MDLELLPDRWMSRDFPVLLAAARAGEAGARLLVEPLAEQLGIAPADVIDSMMALRPTYLDARFTWGEGGTFKHIRLTDDGRRKVGLWPNEDQAAGALVELLAQAADHVEDQDDAGALRKAGRLLKSVPSDIIADVAAALIRQQTGMG